MLSEDTLMETVARLATSRPRSNTLSTMPGCVITKRPSLARASTAGSSM